MPWIPNQVWDDNIMKFRLTLKFMGFFGSMKKISRTELEKMVWEPRDLLDQKQRKLILDIFPEGTTSKIEFIKTIRELRDDGQLSRMDYEALKQAADRYY